MAKTQTSNRPTASKPAPAKPAAKSAAKAKSLVVALNDEYPQPAGQQISNQPATPWEFTLSDHHRVAPDEDRRTILAALEIPVFKHKERLKYAAKWGLDPGYVVITDLMAV